MTAGAVTVTLSSCTCAPPTVLEEREKKKNVTQSLAKILQMY